MTQAYVSTHGHHHDQDSEHSHHPITPRVSSCSLVIPLSCTSSPHPTPPPVNHQYAFCHYSLLCTFSEFHITRIIKHSFFVYLLLFSRVTLRLIHIIVMYQQFVFIAYYYSIVLMYHILFIHLPFDRHSGFSSFGLLLIKPP